jgi:hypothetical protein
MIEANEDLENSIEHGKQAGQKVKEHDSILTKASNKDFRYPF